MSVLLPDQDAAPYPRRMIMFAAQKRVAPPRTFGRSDFEEKEESFDGWKYKRKSAQQEQIDDENKLWAPQPGVNHVRPRSLFSASDAEEEGDHADLGEENKSRTHDEEEGVFKDPTDHRI